MSSPSHHTAPNLEDPGAGQWLADLKRPVRAAPVPHRLVSMPAPNMIPNGWIPAPGFYAGFVVAGAQQQQQQQQQHMAGHSGMVHQHQQPNWSQHQPCVFTPPMTPPMSNAVLYDAHGRSRVPPQVHAYQVHAGHGPQGQFQNMIYVDDNHANLAHLRAQQSEAAAMQQLCARLSLEETDKSPVSGTAPVTAGATAPSEVPAQRPSVPAVAGAPVAMGDTGLKVVPGGATGVTRIILGPDGTTIVPPPDPAHEGCELSVLMANALNKFSLPHCCDYLVAKDLLRDKIVKQVLENTKEKLMELLQNELDKMGEEDEDSDMDFDCEDEEPDWTFEN